MILLISVEIRLQNNPSTVLDVSVSIPSSSYLAASSNTNTKTSVSVTDTNGINTNKFLKLIRQTYDEEREVDPTLPELPSSSTDDDNGNDDHLILTAEGTEFEANDDILVVLKDWSSKETRPVVMDRRDRPKKRIKRVVLGDGAYDNMTVIAGGFRPTIDDFVVVRDKCARETLCLKRDSKLLDVLKKNVFKNDERLVTQAQSGGWGDDSALGAFSFRIPLPDVTRHSHRIIGMADAAATATTAAGDEEEDDSGRMSTDYCLVSPVNNDDDNDTNEALFLLANFLRDKMTFVYAKWEEILQKGLVSFDALAQILSVGSDVVSTSSAGFLQGGTVTNLELQRPCLGEDFWVVEVESVQTDGEAFYKTTEKYTIMDFAPKLMPTTELAVRPIEDEERAHLTQRGRIFRELGVGSHHKAYIGPMSVQCRPMRADGRIMVDVKRYRTINGNERRRVSRYQSSRHNTKAVVALLDDSLLWSTPPSLYAFSFRVRNFGLCHIELMSEILWREDAWSKVALPQAKKDLIHALVVQTRSQAEVDLLEERRWDITRLMNQSQATTGTSTNNDKLADKASMAAAKKIDDELGSEMDLVLGKGGGCNMLFHGKPGTGKTLTAEAISEVLRRPLYTVTVGELGTSAHTLEETLKRVLDLAASWKAIILLDEADVFLAQRDNKDIVRNGLVSIFLRTIEYFNGVLILTTNLPGHIDEAFASRIHVQLYYAPLDAAQRVDVWRNFLETLPPPPSTTTEGINDDDDDNEEMAPSVSPSQPVSRFDYTRLAERYELNGRQIRSTYHVARTLARQKEIDLTQEMLEEVIEYSVQYAGDGKIAY